LNGANKKEKVSNELIFDFFITAVSLLNINKKEINIQKTKENLS
jgi:hypothetical protein